MDGLTFHKIIKIIKKRYTGASVNRISVTKERLYISLFKENNIILLFDTTPPPSFSLTPLIMGESAAVLGNLGGAKLVDIENRPYDRLGKLVFEKHKASGKLIQYVLILEPMGNYSNAFLLNDDNTILYRLSGKNIDPDRDIGVGKEYQQPKANKHFDLDNLGNTEDFSDFTGFYPLTVGIANKYKDTIGFEGTVNMIREELEHNELFYITEKGKISPFPASKSSKTITFDEISRDIGSSDTLKDRKLLSNIIKFYTTQRDRYKKLIVKVENDLQEAQGYAEVNAHAELIKYNLHIIKGIGKYNITQYNENGENEICYKYNRAEDPARYADTLFKRSAKLKRSIPLLEERLMQAHQLAESAEEQIYYVQTADMNELKELSELLKKKMPTKHSKKQELPAFIEYRKGDARIYIGKNSSSNHKLVFQFALASDLWLHTQNIPSAHCLIRSNSKIDEDTIIFAARLTASFSKNKHEQRIPVDYTIRKYVKKPKNTPVGFVIYTNFKTVIVSPFSDEELTLLTMQ